jgi:hypothetical protein
MAAPVADHLPIAGRNPENCLALRGFLLPESVRLSQSAFDERSAAVLEDMADRLEGKSPPGSPIVRNSLEPVEEAAQASQGGAWRTECTDVHAPAPRHRSVDRFFGRRDRRPRGCNRMRTQKPQTAPLVRSLSRYRSGYRGHYESPPLSIQLSIRVPGSIQATGPKIWTGPTGWDSFRSGKKLRRPGFTLHLVTTKDWTE